MNFRSSRTRKISSFLVMIIFLFAIITLSGCSTSKKQPTTSNIEPTATLHGAHIYDNEDNITDEPDNQQYQEESEIVSITDTPSQNSDEGSPIKKSEATPGITAVPTVLPDNSDSVSAMSDEVQTAADDGSAQVTLLAVGDNLIHREVILSGLQEDGTYQYDNLYALVKEKISEADIAVINQETILGGDEFAYSGYPNFNSPTEIGDALISTGFDVILHATNHTLDMGLKGVENTFKYWSKHPEITVLGINQSEEQQKNIHIIEKNGIKIAMLNYTYGLNGYSVPEDMPYLVNMLDKDEMAADISAAEELADFTIVFPHWGSEYIYEATNMQKDLTEFYYEKGVDLVVGTHPHVLEPVEWIETNADHRMLVYYSLGNFMSYQREAPRMLGGIANITITKDENGTYISDAGITPIVTHYENGHADYHYGIYELTKYTKELALLHGILKMERRSEFTYQGTYDLAKQILGPWFKQD